MFISNKETVIAVSEEIRKKDRAIKKIIAGFVNRTFLLRRVI
jgi:hypothetical protein